jgi:hypothetical protein
LVVVEVQPCQICKVSQGLGDAACVKLNEKIGGQLGVTAAKNDKK